MSNQIFKNAVIVTKMSTGLLLITGIIFLLCKYENIFNKFDSNTAAAWTQTIGSILAILATILAVYIQHDNEIKRVLLSEKRNRMEKLQVVMIMFFGVFQKCKDIATKIRRREGIWEMEIRFLAEQRNRLSSVPAFDIPKATLYAKNSLLITTLQLVETGIMALNDQTKKQISLPDKFYDAIEFSLHTAADVAITGIINAAQLYFDESGLASNSVLTELGIDVEDCLRQNSSSFFADLKAIRPNGYS